MAHGDEQVYRGPSTDELVFLLEKQDSMLESLMAEMSLCKDQIKTLKQSSEVQTKENLESKATMSEAQERVTSALKAMERLQDQNTRLEAEIAELRKTTAVEPIQSVMELRDRIKEKDFELDREKRSAEGVRVELEREKMKTEQLRLDLETTTKVRKEMTASLNGRIEVLSRELAEAQLKVEALSSATDESTAKISSQVEVLSQRESFLEGYCSQLAKELAILRKEKTMMSSRVAALGEENAALRTKAMRNALNDTLNEAVPDEQMQKLIEDQCHLISALKEECQILTEKLELERSTHRSKQKSLKRDKKELEERMQKLLNI